MKFCSKLQVSVGENSATSVPVLMLLDEGSQKSYITNSLKTQLNLKPVKKKNKQFIRTLLVLTIIKSMF